MAEVNGSCDKRFQAVRDALAQSLRDRDVGASAAVFVDGKPVADLWGGYADAARAVPWQRDTVVNVWSVSKTMLALCALILADRGVLDLDAPVCRYWPEFAAAGKENVLVRHVLAHTAGLPHLDGMVSEEDLYDWPGVTARLAVQAPRWKPGTQAGYHSLTQGFLLGEVIRRVTGRRPGAFFAAEVAGPLGADFQFTLPMADDGRFAAGLAPPGAQADWRSSAPASAGNEAEGGAGSAAGTSAGGGAGSGAGSEEDGAAPAGIRLAVANTPAWRRAEVPSGSGYGNARSVAAVQSVLACGGMVRGVRLLSAEGCALASQEQYRGIDQVTGASVRYGMGYGIFDPAVGWAGWGGSLVMTDPDARMTVAYTMNQMLDRGYDRGLAIVIAAYDGFGS
jgi:CubicO group peptidase (beta-lactamase class C family)